MKNMVYYLLGCVLFVQSMHCMQPLEKESSEEEIYVNQDECSVKFMVFEAMQEHDIPMIYDIVKKHKYLASVPLPYAVKNQKYHLIRFLIDTGADVNKRGNDDLVYNKRTPLYLAVANGDIELCRHLIEHGADVNAPDIYNDETPLMYACSDNNLEIAKVLIEHNAELNTVSKYGEYTALYCAAMQCGAEICKYLIEHGADVAAGGKFCVRNMLLIACTFPHGFEVAKILIEHGANINVQAMNGVSPLSKVLVSYLWFCKRLEMEPYNIHNICAINYNREQCDKYKQMIVFLIEHGADIESAKDYNGKSLKDEFLCGSGIPDSDPVRQLIIKELQRKEEPIRSWFNNVRHAIKGFTSSKPAISNNNVVEPQMDLD